MLVKWLKKTGNGSARATVDYMLGKNRDRAGAKAMNGLEKTERTAKLADSLRHKHKYAVGVLSFEESPDDISTDKKIEIIQSFERTIFAGLEPDQYDISWIEHTDKGRLELNFIIPKVELRSGKAMNPYLHGKDTALIDTWKNIINAEYGLTDPNDPAKRHTTTHRQRLPKDKKELASAIDESITMRITAGNIQNRADIIEHLESLGLSVTKQTKQSLSVHHADMGKRPLRLTGVYYEQNFTAGSIDQEYIEDRSREYRARAGERLRQDKAEYQQLLERRSKYNQSRYSSPAVEVISERSRRSRSSDRPSSQADRTADHPAAAAHQFTDQRAGSADITAADHPAAAVVGGVASASGQDDQRSGLVRAQTGSSDRQLQAAFEQGDRSVSWHGAGSRITAVEHQSHDEDDPRRTERPLSIVQSDSAQIRTDGRTGWISDAEAGRSHRIDSAAYATTHRSDTAAHDSTAGNDRQDSEQVGRIDHTQAISAHLLSAGSDRMDHAASDNNSVQRLQYVRQFQDSERTRYTDSTEASDISRHQQTDQRSARKPVEQPSYDRADSGRHINQVTPPDSNESHQQERHHSITRSESVIDREITEHDRHPFLIEIQAAFRRIRAAATRAAAATLDRVRTRITAATGSANTAKSTDRAIEDIERAIEQREQRATRSDRDIDTDQQRAGEQDRAVASGLGADDDEARELAGYSAETSEDDRRISISKQQLEQSQHTAKHTDRYIEERAEESRTANDYIVQLDQRVQTLNQQRIDAEKAAEQQREAQRLEQIRLAQLEEEKKREQARQRPARDEYSTPNPFD